MESSKKLVTIFIAPFAIAIILLALAGAWRLIQPDYKYMPTIAVSGEGKVTAKPDTAQIDFSVVTQGQNPVTVQSDNDKRMANATEFLTSQGVGDADIKTIGYSLYPQYEYAQGTTKPPRIAGYSLTQSVSVKVHDLGKVGTIVGGLADRGVNQISNVSFFVDVVDSYRAEARKQAIDKASAQAHAIAAQLGVGLGRVVQYSEVPKLVPPVPYGAASYGQGGGAEVSPVQSGTEDITVTVNVSYALR